jgi:hypothetical protein
VVGDLRVMVRDLSAAVRLAAQTMRMIDTTQLKILFARRVLIAPAINVRRHHRCAQQGPQQPQPPIYLLKGRRRPELARDDQL